MWSGKLLHIRPFDAGIGDLDDQDRTVVLARFIDCERGIWRVVAEGVGTRRSRPFRPVLVERQMPGNAVGPVGEIEPLRAQVHQPDRFGGLIDDGAGRQLHEHEHRLVIFCHDTAARQKPQARPPRPSRKACGATRSSPRRHRYLVSWLSPG